VAVPRIVVHTERIDLDPAIREGGRTVGAGVVSKILA
jgi:translation elongation factor EF-Tu-like GTPase